MLGSNEKTIMVHAEHVDSSNGMVQSEGDRMKHSVRAPPCDELCVIGMAGSRREHAGLQMTRHNPGADCLTEARNILARGLKKSDKPMLAQDTLYEISKDLKDTWREPPDAAILDNKKNITSVDLENFWPLG
ncbi:hypothetical protein HPP92_029052 [Vanilla planifolia]|uniref:Uncharacterized protein n=1 Tax=Vanilla planifolia TaxID=51239 RepID=A0A835U4P0_VANPL|nr:hypothetical protein HPP92_029052 [Vanilla planifolia]KAG0446015.1 hypothetical protein HPP92_029041 [Vanilla planifolia]